MRTRYLTLGLLVACGTLAGCAQFAGGRSDPPPPQDLTESWRTQPIDGSPVQRVVVMPFHDATRRMRGAETIRTQFMASMAAGRQVEVVPLDETLLDPAELDSVFRSGLVSRETLLKVAKHHRADGVINGVVTRWRPYPPFAIGLRVNMVSASTGDTLWEALGEFDSEDRRVAADVENWHSRTLSASDSLEGWERILSSPRQFAAYATSRMVASY